MYQPGYRFLRLNKFNLRPGQKDRLTNEWKYLVNGQSIAGNHLVALTKFGPTGKLVIITVYLI
jgi:hypothetical protein